MKLLAKRTSFWFFAVVVVTIVACLAEEPIENLRVKLEYYPTGELKREVFAKLAEVPPNGDIVAHGLELKELAKDGSVQIKINADDCRFNQDKQTATSTNRVVLKREGMTVSGKGFDWDGNKQKIKILKNARVEFPAAIVKKEGVLKNVKKRK